VSETACGLSIGPVSVRNNAFLAPMAGITDRPMRDLAARHGAGLVVSEMIASSALVAGQDDMVRRVRKSDGLPHVVQLAGCEARWLAEGARLAEDAGADVIDLNLGCPSKRVTNGFAGSALMRVPDQALSLIEATVAATSRPVTVKMRLGWDDNSLNAPAIAKRAEEAGARMITVHARTRQQFYKGEARWHLVRAVREAISVPLVVNGDIADLARARTALAESGADAVMIGRGAQGQPWRVGQIGDALAGRAVRPGPQGRALLDLMLAHYEDMLGEYGRALGVRVARKHLGWYLDAAGIGDPTGRKALLTQEDPGRVIAALPALFDAAWSAAA